MGLHWEGPQRNELQDVPGCCHFPHVSSPLSTLDDPGGATHFICLQPFMSQVLLCVKLECGGFWKAVPRRWILSLQAPGYDPIAIELL